MTGKKSVEDHLPLSAAHFHVLLSLTEGPMHGYGVKREVEERTDGRIRLAAGSLYEGIQRLQRKELISEAPAPEDPGAKGSSRWRFYGITPLGRQVLRAELARLEADIAIARAKVG